MAKRNSKAPLKKKIISSLIWLGTLPLCLYTLLTYLLSYSLIVEHWFAGFIMMTMPYAQLLCLISLIYWVFQRAKRALLPLIVLALGYGFIGRTISFNQPVATLEKPLTVMSYNVFGMYSNEYEAKKEQLEDLKKFIRDYDADIKCFQEFYSHSDRKAYHTVSFLKEKYPHYAFIDRKSVV